MAKFNASILVGSLRKASINLKLAKALTKLGENHFEANFLRIDDLPLFNQDLETNFPPEATRLKNALKASDGILIVTPEYNRSMPAPLKNAIDWASRPYGTNSFARKPIAIIGASVGAIGTACAQHNLRPTLGYLDVILMGQPEGYIHFVKDLIDTDGNIANEDTKKFLQSYVDSFSAWVNRHHCNQG